MFEFKQGTVIVLFKLMNSGYLRFDTIYNYLSYIQWQYKV